jgi:hypothetical protein
MCTVCFHTKLYVIHVSAIKWKVKFRFLAVAMLGTFFENWNPKCSGATIMSTVVELRTPFHIGIISSRKSML